MQGPGAIGHQKVIVLGAELVLVAGVLIVLMWDQARWAGPGEMFTADLLREPSLLGRVH